MIRHFRFEQEIYDTLELVPMAVRRKLDKIGIKLGLDQWQALGRGERLAICHLPTNLDEECEALRVFVQESVKRATGAEAKTLSEADRAIADPPDSPPVGLTERAKAVGFVLDQDSWSKLDADARYALIRMGLGKAVSHNFASALQEFLIPQSEPAQAAEDESAASTAAAQPAKPRKRSS